MGYDRGRPIMLRHRAPSSYVTSMSRGAIVALMLVVLAACGEGFRTSAPPGAASEPPVASASASPTPTSASSHPPVEEIAKRFMRAAIACDRAAALADVGTAEDAHEVMTRELDRTEIDEETAHFLDKQCKRLGGAHHAEIADARLDGTRHLSSKKEHYLLRDVDIVAVTVNVQAGGKLAEHVTLHFFETVRGWRFTPRP